MDDLRFEMDQILHAISWYAKQHRLSPEEIAAVFESGLVACFKSGDPAILRLAESGSVPGLELIRLEDGTPLSRIDENTFKNTQTGELLSLQRPTLH